MIKGLALATTLLVTPAVAETIIITKDDGGYIFEYYSRYMQYNVHATTVILDGICWSACTMVVIVKDSCTTERGLLAFHAARDVKTGKSPAPLIRAQLDYYPKPVREAIQRRGGLTAEWMFMPASEFLPICNG